MAFAIGSISSPAPATGFLYGTVVTPDLMNLVCGNINGWIQGTNNLWPAVSGTTAPTPAFTKNVVYGDILPIAWGQWGNGPGFLRGANIASFVRNSAGNYTITLNTAAASANDLAIFTTANNAVGSVFNCQTFSGTGASFSVFTSVAGTPTDPSKLAWVCFGV
jgi:hypothetical protein